MKSQSRRIQFLECIGDLLETPEVQQMRKFSQHGNVNCFEHSLYVSYMSFLICRFFRLNYASAARGGLLHDLFLYDWRVKGSHKGLHGFTHPRAALEKASGLFELNRLERDIIVKHMWPLTLRFPRYRESYVVNLSDKLCAMAELLHIYHKVRMRTKLADAWWAASPLLDARRTQKPAACSSVL